MAEDQMIMPCSIPRNWTNHSMTHELCAEVTVTMYHLAVTMTSRGLAHSVNYINYFCDFSITWLRFLVLSHFSYIMGRITRNSLHSYFSILLTQLCRVDLTDKMLESGRSKTSPCRKHSFSVHFSISRSSFSERLNLGSFGWGAAEVQTQGFLMPNRHWWRLLCLGNSPLLKLMFWS